MAHAPSLRIVFVLVVLLYHNVRVAQSKAGWHDKNIILQNGHWEHLDMDKLLGHPPPPVDDKHLKNDTSIVVLIASLRETRLADTLASLFDNAAHPSRVHVGVVQQNAESDTDIVEDFCSKRGRPLTKDPTTGGFVNENDCREFNNIRVIRMDVSEAAGPVFARARQAELVQPQDDFCFQIDAHTIFRTNWDMLILREWGLTRNEFAVLTTYPTNYKHLYENSNKHWEMPHLCDASIQRGVVHNKQAKAVANLDRPLLSPLWAAGEEYGRGVRLWTHGYDFYSITRPIIGTYYGAEKGGKGGWRSEGKEMSQSLNRLRTLVEHKDSDQSPEALEHLGKYGLGRRRTLDQYIAFSGLDPRNDQVNMKCMVEYVPWGKAKGQRPKLRRRRPVVDVLNSDEGYTQMMEATERRQKHEVMMHMYGGALIAVVVLGLIFLYANSFCCRKPRTVWERNVRAVRKLRKRQPID